MKVILIAISFVSAISVLLSVISFFYICPNFKLFKPVFLLILLIFQFFQFIWVHLRPMKPAEAIKTQYGKFRFASDLVYQLTIISLINTVNFIGIELVVPEILVLLMGK